MKTSLIGFLVAAAVFAGCAHSSAIPATPVVPRPCYPICPTPTVTMMAPIKCLLPTRPIICPDVLCAFDENAPLTYTVTATHTCAGAACNPSLLPTANCETVPAATVTATGCPKPCGEPCTRPTETVHVACPL